MPEDKYTEARHQTQHKLEAMERYWDAWVSILAQTMGKYPFCPTRLWLIDTHAGQGRHRSAEDPEGEVPGTAILAALSARRGQRKFPGVVVTVRATDKAADIAKELDERFAVLRGEPPAGIDATALPLDWVDNVPRIKAELAEVDHPHGGAPGSQSHDHRSLWFVDPFGIESIDHSVISSFPVGSEVIVNLDLAALVRHAARATDGEPGIVAILRRAYGGEGWRRLVGMSDLQAIADTFAHSFSARRWRFREAHLLRASGSQYRAMVHLTTTKLARDTFEKKMKTAMAAGTLAAGDILTKPQKDQAAHRLHGLYRGLTVTTKEMQPVGTWTLGQLRAICTAADAIGLGRWDEASKRIEWREEPRNVAGSQEGLWGAG